MQSHKLGPPKNNVLAARSRQCPLTSLWIVLRRSWFAAFTVFRYWFTRELYMMDGQLFIFDDIITYYRKVIESGTPASKCICFIIGKFTVHKNLLKYHDKAYRRRCWYWCRAAFPDKTVSPIEECSISFIGWSVNGHKVKENYLTATVSLLLSHSPKATKWTC